MRYEKLVNPIFLNPETMRCRGVKKDGSVVEIDFTIPEGERKGVNEYFDWIVDNYSLTDIKAAYHRALKEHVARKQQREEDEQKQKEVERLSQLFDAKSNCFEMQFIKDAPAEVRSAIRRSPNQMILQLIVTDYFKTFLSEKQMSYNDYLDYVEEIEYEEQQLNNE